MSASVGTRSASRAGRSSVTSPNSSGRSSPAGLGKARRTRTVRVFGSSTGSMKSTFPGQVRSGYAPSRSDAGMPAVTKRSSLSYTSASTHTVERSTTS